MTEKEIELIAKLTESSIIISEMRGENKILKDFYEKNMQALSFKGINKQVTDDISRICRFYIEWTNNRERNGVELYGLDYELKNAAERVLQELNVIKLLINNKTQ